MSSINLFSELKALVSKRVLEYLPVEIRPDPSVFKFEIPPDAKLGHLAFACFPLAKILKKAPPVIATELQNLWDNDACFKKVEAVGPYLNFRFSPDYLIGQLGAVTDEQSDYGDNVEGKGKRVMLEFSSPNTNKPLHLGHGRNNLLGACLAELFKHNGFEVIKANLINDRGIHICKSMLAYQKWGEGKTPDSQGVKGDKLVGDFYVLYDKKEKENPELIEEANQMLRDWEAGKPEVIELWKKMNGWVLDGFAESYRRMGIAFDQFYYESETYQGGRELILQKLKEGHCQQEDNGAVSIDLEKDKLGKKILLRGDGTSMYITQDINTTLTKFSDYDLERCLFVVGNEQDNHFRVLFKVLERFGYDWSDRLEHISYGMITLPEGKMKSREGTVVDLDDLMDAMSEMAFDEIKQRRHLGGDKNLEDWKKTAEAIGQAAIRFYILKTNAAKEIQFDPKESLSFDGMTGPYLQYTHARISSLLRKDEEVTKPGFDKGYAWNLDETYLLVVVARLPDVIQQSLVERNPAHLCNYTYELCRLYNKFYYEYPILKAEDPQAVRIRVFLSKTVRAVLAKTLRILGIEALERM